jgi:AraC-like DNA-binding protein
LALDSALSLLHAFAAFNGLIIATILMATGKRESRRSRITLGGFLLIAAGLLGLFVLLERGLIVYGPRTGILMAVMSAAMPVLFLDYIFTTVGFKRGRNWLYLIVPVFGLVAVWFGDVLGEVTDFAGGIALQMAATLIGAIFWWRAWRHPATSPKRLKAMRLLPYLFGLMAILHVAQIARFFFPDTRLLFDLVPTIGTLGLTGFVVASIFGSRTLSHMVSTPNERPRDPAMEMALQANVVASGAVLDQGVTLDTVSALVPTDAQVLSDYINSAHGETFREWLNRHRIRHAKTLLANPDEHRTSIEAVGMLSGFRSRSAFYEAFRAATGQTPRQYRQQAAGK